MISYTTAHHFEMEVGDPKSDLNSGRASCGEIYLLELTDALRLLGWRVNDAIKVSHASLCGDNMDCNWSSASGCLEACNPAAEEQRQRSLASTAYAASDNRRDSNPN